MSTNEEAGSQPRRLSPQEYHNLAARETLRRVEEKFATLGSERPDLIDPLNQIRCGILRSLSVNSNGSSLHEQHRP
jgi:hypothetical protein